MTQRIATLSIDRSFLESVDLVSLIEQRSPTRFGKPSGNGTKRTVKGPCPWCGGEDRFAVFVSEIPQRFYCGIHGNGCGKHGDAITFLREYEHKSFKEAYAELTGLDIPQATQQAYKPIADVWKTKAWQEKTARFCSDAEKLLWEDDSHGPEVLVYLLDRGFTEQTVKNAHLGAALYNGALCLVIPWFDSKQGMYYRVELRDINPDAEKRYKNYPDSSVSDGMYGTDSLLFTRPAIFLVEGALDALSIAQEASDLVSVVSTGSTGGSHNPKWLMRLANVPHVFVAFDSEEKGEKSAKYWLDALPNATRWRTPIGKDANEMLQRDISIREWVEQAIATLQVKTKETLAETVAPTCEICGAMMDGYYGGKWLCGAHYDEAKDSAGLKRTRKATTPGAAIPSWLRPGTHDWEKQVARNGLREMMARRSAWFAETSQDVVLAEAL